MAIPLPSPPPASTTSLKLPDDVKRLATTEVQRLAITPRAFMVGAIRVACRKARA